MTRSTLPKLTLSMLLLTGCGASVVLAKDDPQPDAGAGGGPTGSGSSGGAGVSSSVSSGGSGGAAPAMSTGSSGGSAVDAMAPQPEVPDQASGHFKVLVFTRTLEFVHDSIETGVSMLKGMGAELGDFDVVETKEPGDFNEASLSQYAVVVFLSTTGQVLTMSPGADAEKAAFQSYMNHGGGYVGIHAAASTENTWPWYVDLLGASMANHDGDGTPGTVLVDETTIHHPSTFGLPTSWARTDEWFTMSRSLAPEIKVLASLDEPEHRPVSWIHELTGGGRMFYTVQGHNRSCYAEPLFRKHILGAVEWAAHRQDAKPGAPLP